MFIAETLMKRGSMWKVNRNLKGFILPNILFPLSGLMPEQGLHFVVDIQDPHFPVISAARCP